MDHAYVGATLGAVDVKITHSTQGVSVEVDVKRPREDGESFEVAASRAAGIAARAYIHAVEQMAAAGLVPGPFKKAGA